MTFGATMTTLFEIALVAVTLWALLHEDRIAALEERFFAYCRRKRLSVVRSENSQKNYVRRGF